jgi:hypothetical protein
MLTVKLLPHQNYYLQAPYLYPKTRYFLLCAGYGAGKTRSNVFKTLHLVKRLQGKKDPAGDHARILVAGYTLSHLEATFLIYFRQALNTSRTPYIEDKKHNLFIIGTVMVMLVPLENPERLFGRDVYACIAEEIDELTEDKCVEAVRALSERCRQQIVGERGAQLSFGSTAQGTKGLYRIYNHFQQFGVGFILIRGRTEDNVYLPASYVQDMKRMYTPDEFEVYAHGKFLSVSKGRVFPEFDWKRNYLDYDLDQNLAPGEEVIVGQDFNTGFSRASAYIVRGNVIYCIKAYDFPNPLDSPGVFRHDFPDQNILWAPDVTIKDSFPQFGRELRRYNIHTIYRKKSPLVEDTVFLINKLLRLERLMVCRIASPVAEAMSNFMRDADNKIPKGKGPSSPAHLVDSVRYTCAFLAANRNDFSDIQRLIVEKRASLRNNGEAPVTALNAGYSRISPAAM